jgi:glycosyl hydrolase family 39 (putative alpha-L-iduronidase)
MCRHLILILVAVVAVFAPGLVAAQPGPAAAGPAAAESMPFGIGFSGGAATEKVFPHLENAGVQWIRTFPEWSQLEPKLNQFDWTSSDELVKLARAHHLRIVGLLLYFAPWSSTHAEGSTDWRVVRYGFPVKKMDYWRDYVRAVVERYRDDITYWEIWNEPNAPSFNTHGTPKDYADLVREADIVAKQVNPQARIGITCATFDVGYLDQVIRHGAAGHFDFVCVHPYESVGYLFGSDAGFLHMAGTLRQMLAKNQQRPNLPLWMTEIGVTTTQDPQQEQRQAAALLKTYLLGVVQGFDRIFWFEARGPKYDGGQFGIIRDDYSPRPAYAAYKTMTAQLGPTPRYVGWVNQGGNGYGFVFAGHDGPVLATWATHVRATISFTGPVSVSDMAGKTMSLAAGEELTLGDVPVFVGRLPAEIVESARKNASQPFPWTKDYSKADGVWCRLGVANTEFGIVQKHDGPKADGEATPGIIDGQEYRGTENAHGKHYIFFDVDSSYAALGDNDLEITVVARRSDPNKDAGITLTYESPKGYVQPPEWWSIPAGSKWQEHTWHVTDASFAHMWGWNFQVNAVSSHSDVWVKEVRLKRHRAQP